MVVQDSKNGFGILGCRRSLCQRSTSASCHNAKSVRCFERKAYREVKRWTVCDQGLMNRCTSNLIHLDNKIPGLTSSVQLCMHVSPSVRIIQKNLQRALLPMMPWIGIPRSVCDHKVKPRWYLTMNLKWQLPAGYTFCKRTHFQREHVAE